MPQIITHNKALDKLLRAQKRNDGQIAQDVYISANYDCDTLQLVHFYLGHRYTGPILQYSEDGHCKYNGVDHTDHECGAWTPIYSRGNFGRRYAFGGNWSGHCRSLHPRAGDQTRRDKKVDIILLDDNKFAAMPDGIATDLTMHDIDCSLEWSLWFSTAQRAMEERLTTAEILESSLPDVTKRHLSATQTPECVGAINEIINVFKI